MCSNNHRLSSASVHDQAQSNGRKSGGLINIHNMCAKKTKSWNFTSTVLDIKLVVVPCQLVIVQCQLVVVQR